MNFSEIYKKYDEVKSGKDYIEYENEITTNKLILNSYPFKEQCAKKQLSYLIIKYEKELNAFAKLQGNGMTVSHNPPSKTQTQTLNDLDYVNSLIPLFALERTGKSYIIKSLIEQVGGNFNG